MTTPSEAQVRSSPATVWWDDWTDAATPRGAEICHVKGTLEIKGRGGVCKSPRCERPECTEDGLCCAEFWKATWTVLRGALTVMYDRVAASEQDAKTLKPRTMLITLGFKALLDAGDAFVKVCSAPAAQPSMIHPAATADCALGTMCGFAAAGACCCEGGAALSCSMQTACTTVNAKSAVTVCECAC